MIDLYFSQEIKKRIKDKQKVIKHMHKKVHNYPKESSQMHHNLMFDYDASSHHVKKCYKVENPHTIHHISKI